MNKFNNDQLNKFVDEGKILQIKSGSHLYGTNTENSDIDYLGIYVPSYYELLTSDSFVNEIDLSVVDKLNNGKNSTNAVDCKYYAFKNFINLAMTNTPNILEMLFVNPENIIFINDFGQKLLNSKQMFLHKGLLNRFVGYANSQAHKMIIKSDKFNEMNLITAYLKNIEPKKIIAELQYDNDFIKILEKCDSMEIKHDGYKKRNNRFHDNFLTIGDLNIPNNVYVKNAIMRLNERIKKGTNRNDLILSHGYDLKFASHVIRLLQEGLELIEYQKISFPLKNKELILDIKAGKWSVNDVLKLKEELIEECNQKIKYCDLPDIIDYEKIDSFVEQFLKGWINK
jgi:predicted nucleotidyltransferase